ncbi:MAG: M42 family peptidase, partial [Butyricicoccus sp.]|nr:M42 family peptidase [Butyricicoccus sp.]
DPVRDYLMEQAKPYADEMRVDAMGNLIIFKKGAKATGKKLMLCAHMDEVGLIIKHITDDGYLKFAPIGGIDRRVLIGKRVFVGWNRIPGIIGLKAVHMTTAEERGKVPKLEEYYLDIGAKDREEAESLVSLGDFAVFNNECMEFGNGYFKAKAIDDRVGCAVMLKMLQRDLPMDCYFVFTVQEEVGTRGAFGAAFSVTPEIALVLETTTAADIAGIKGQKRVCTPGQGPVISLMDGGTIYDKELFRLMCDTADANKIPWQVKHYIAGGNDSRAIQRTKAGVRVAGLSAAVRYLHAPTSVGATKDFEQMLTLTAAFVDALAQSC